MICTSQNVITCLSGGLAKNNKIMSMFVLAFSHFESLALFSKIARAVNCKVLLMLRCKFCFRISRCTSKTNKALI